MHKRISLELNDDMAEMACWDELTKVISSDMSEAIHFILEDGSDEEVYYLSEVTQDVYELTESGEFLDALAARAETMSDQEQRRSVRQEITLLRP